MSRTTTLKRIVPALVLAAAVIAVWTMSALTADVDAVLRSGAGGTEAQLPQARAASDQAPVRQEVDTSQWTLASATIEGVAYSFRYPQGWSAQLAYCGPGAAADQTSGHLPAGCAGTDFLAGQKARDVGTLVGGSSLKVSGMNALRVVDDSPSSVIVSQVYTVMVYGESGQPLFGFSTMIGPGTNPAEISAITGTLDGVVSTLRVEVAR